MGVFGPKCNIIIICGFNIIFNKYNIINELYLTFLMISILQNCYFGLILVSSFTMQDNMFVSLDNSNILIVHID